MPKKKKLSFPAQNQQEKVRLNFTSTSIWQLVLWLNQSWDNEFELRSSNGENAMSQDTKMVAKLNQLRLKNNRSPWTVDM